jgi:hypothetical protein
VGDAADARLAQWEAARAPDGSATLARGCVTAKIPGWVEDMRPPIVARTVGLAAWTASKIAGEPIEAKPDGALVVAAGGPHRGASRTFVGFEPGRVASCFAVCVGPQCEVLSSAHLEGSSAPPPPGPFLGALEWLVYHPIPSACSAAILIALIAVIAVKSRRRPRFRLTPDP